MAFDPNANLIQVTPKESATINITSDKTSIVTLRHPDYSEMVEDWRKFRLTYKGGKTFVREYLKKLSKREGNEDFNDRKDMSYCPNFAGAAIKDIKNSIFQRTADVTRTGGSKTYQDAVDGQGGGVDLQGSTMGSFIGTEIIDQLLVMSKVGVLLDNFNDIGTTEAEQRGKHPYVDVYHAEDILSWAPRKPINGFTHLLLREFVDTVNKWGLPDGREERYRLYRKTPTDVEVTFYDHNGDLQSTMILDLVDIPFVQFDIALSLLTDVADYQIALTNLESSDISFARKSNYPFFYEFTDQRVDGGSRKPVAEPDNTGTQAENVSRDKEVRVGLTQGRQYPKGLDPPGFVNPDPETLKVSMEKGEQLKKDIRLLINLNLMNANPRRQSAESKQEDSRSLEAGLSYIGLELQRGEQEIARIWHMFEGQANVVKVNYPKTYNLRSEEDRQSEAERLEKLSDKIPSDKFRRFMKRKIARILAGGDVTDEIMRAIEKEIEVSDILTSDTNVILSAYKSGLVDDVTASNALGFDGKSVIKQAKLDRAERIKLTMEAQGGEGGPDRGAPEFDKGVPRTEKDGKDQRNREDASNIGSEK